MRTLIIYLLMASAAAFVGCSGGGQSALSLVGGASPPETQGAARVTFTLSIPQNAPASAQRAPKYISSGTQSIGIAVAASGASPGAPTIANLTPGSPNCSTSGTSLDCAVTMLAPPGNDTFAVTLYSGTNGGGSALSTATVQGTVTAYQVNTIPITLEGVVANVTISVTNGNDAVPGGYATTLPVTVTAKDASGEVIVGSYFNPLTLTNSDTSGSITTLSATTPLTAPTSGITLTYDPTTANHGTLTNATATIGVTASPQPTVSPGVFAYIADRFFGYNHTRTLVGQVQVTTNTYNASGTLTNSTTVVYALTDQLTVSPGATFNSVSGLIDEHHVFSYVPVTQPTATPETETIDYYEAYVPGASGGWTVYRYGKTDVDDNPGASNSTITLNPPGTTTQTYTYQTTSGTPFEIDVLPHAGTNWTLSNLPFTETWSGTSNGTFTQNADGSLMFSQSSPSTVTYTQTAAGSVTSLGYFFGPDVTVTIGAPSDGSPIPVAVETTIPAPQPTTTYSAVNWYPGQTISQPLTETVYELTSTGPPSCASSTGSSSWDLLTEQLSGVEPYAFADLSPRTVQDFYVPGTGWVCETDVHTLTTYSVTTGLMSSQVLWSYSFSVTNSGGNLSIGRKAP